MVTRTSILGVAMCAWILFGSAAFGQGGMGGMGGGRGHGGMGSGGSDHQKSSFDDHRDVVLLPQENALKPHGVSTSRPSPTIMKSSTCHFRPASTCSTTR